MSATDWSEGLAHVWAFGGATGAGVRVCVVDSGIERDHPLVGEVEQSMVVTVDG